MQILVLGILFFLFVCPSDRFLKWHTTRL